MLNIDIVADFVCPWCFIGKRRLETAIATIRREQPEAQINTRWRPFFLNPDTPAGGEPYLPFLEHKFGSMEAVNALFERVRAGGRAYGVDFAFERISLRANTLLAHRLVQWAQRYGDADALVERLFVAQFQRGEAIGDPDVLTGIAGECGYPVAAWIAWRDAGSDTEGVRADERRLRSLGIRMVPTYIVDGTQLIAGAEDPGILAAAMRARLA
ncbi:MAG: DsbA family oxidoreductase [Dechloromonas sp.]|nr:MAG: DsbA family oxidoreductase [Dechloromonas sp.]